MSGLPSKLIEAIRSRNLEKVKALLNAGVDSNCIFSNKQTILEIAIRYGSLGIVKVLLDAGADPNTGNALKRATGRGIPQIFEELLKTGANLNHALKIVVKRGSLDEIKLLLKYSNNYNTRFSNGKEALRKALNRKSFNIVRILLAYGVISKSDLQSQLLNRIQLGHRTVVEILLDARVDPNVKNIYGESTLDMAFKIDKKIVSLLKRSSANQHCSYFLRLKEIIKSKYSDERIVEKFLEVVKDLAGSSTTDSYSTALLKAIEYGNALRNQISRKHGLQSTIESTLQNSIEYEPINNLVKSLLDSGVNPDSTYYDGKSALQIAIKGLNLRAIILLLEYSANPENLLTKINSFNIFSLAINCGTISDLKELLKAGLDSNSRSNGIHILSEAVFSENSSMVKELLKAGSNPNVYCITGEPILHEAIKQENISVVKAFLKAGSDPNSRDRQGVPILHRAIQLRNIQIVKLLTDSISSINDMKNHISSKWESSNY